MNEIRFKIDDILSGNLIDDISLSLNMIFKKKAFERVIFWNNGISNTKLNKFEKMIQMKLDDQICIYMTNRTPQVEYIWFDVVNDNDSIKNKFRFSYIYPIDKKSNMILGIYSFFKVMDFVEKSKGRRVKYKKEDKM